ncbi:MAG: toll/interleukin-1 receptor domain-containing protein [Chloroflexia bacterium]
MEQYDVFLSHNSRDKPLVEAVAAGLHQVGVRSWLDKQRLTPGGRWQDELAQGLTASSGCAVFVGPHGLGDWVREELAVALDLAAKDRNYRLFLVLLPGTPEPFDPSTLPPFLTTRTWVDMRRGIDDVSAFATLLAAIRGAAPSLHTDDARLSPDSSAVRPSPLHNFPAEPTPLIGRVRETAEVRTMLRRETFVCSRSLDRGEPARRESRFTPPS